MDPKRLGMLAQTNKPPPNKGDVRPVALQLNCYRLQLSINDPCSPSRQSSMLLPQIHDKSNSIATTDLLQLVRLISLFQVQRPGTESKAVDHSCSWIGFSRHECTTGACGRKHVVFAILYVLVQFKKDISVEDREQIVCVISVISDGRTTGVAEKREVCCPSCFYPPEPREERVAQLTPHTSQRVGDRETNRDGERNWQRKRRDATTT